MKCDANPIILKDFLDYLQEIKCYSSKTIKSYHSDLLIFFTFIKEYLNLKVDVAEFNMFIVMQIKRTDILAFLVYLNYNKKNSSYTRQRRLTSIRTFYKWLLTTQNTGEMNVNPANEIDNIHKCKRLPKYLNLSQAKKIQNIFTIKNSMFPIRNNAIISLLLSTGIRVSELVQINIEHINFNNNCIHIMGKGKKERTVYFSNSCKNQLLDYIELRKKKESQTKIIGALFMNSYQKRIGIDGIQNICEKAYQLMGLQEYGYTAHTLRHTAASLMYKYVKPDILLIKEFLGHKSLTSTQIYTHICNLETKKAVDQNPLNEYCKKKGEKHEIRF